MDTHLGGRIVNGEPAFWEGDRQRYDEFIKKHEGKPFRMLLTAHRPKRTTNQNRYLWGVVYTLISDHTGYTPEDIHGFCAEKFLPGRVVIGGEERTVPGKTSNLDTLQFQDYVGKIQRWAAEFLSVVIPDPSQTEWLQEEPT
jgi:hypothetical protein